MGLAQTILTTFIGWAVCLCTAAVALAVGLDVEHDEFVPLPFFFTDVPIYAEQGVNAFLRYGQILVIVVLACLPAFAGTSLVYFDPIATAGIPFPCSNRIAASHNTNRHRRHLNRPPNCCPAISNISDSITRR